MHLAVQNPHHKCEWETRTITNKKTDSLYLIIIIHVHVHVHFFICLRCLSVFLSFHLKCYHVCVCVCVCVRACVIQHTLQSLHNSYSTKSSALKKTVFCGFNHVHEIKLVELESDCHGRKLRASLTL